MTKRVLVVDDDTMVRATLQMMLADEGYTVDMAENGDQALALCAQHTYTFLVMDVVMPRKSGFDVLQELAKQGSAPKVIAVSGTMTGVGDYLEIARKLGAADILYKPFTHEELMAKINALGV